MFWFLISIGALLAWTFFAFKSLSLGFTFKWLSLDEHSMVSIFALVVFALALFFGIKGYLNDESFSANIATELASIAITVFVIDRLYERRSAAQRKEQIIKQMGSRVNDVALEAVRLARDYGWLEDGSLIGAYLGGANLQEAYVIDVNLQGANVHGTNLRGAHLGGANLQGATLLNVYLQGAKLYGANLRGAILVDVYLQGAKYNEHTKWPEDFDPKSAGAIKEKIDSVSMKWVVDE